MRNRKRGQTTTEYLLVVSVLVIAFAAVVWQPLNDAFTGGSNDYKDKMTTYTNKGVFDDGGNKER